METVGDFIFGRLQNHLSSDGDCSHEIQRCLLLGRKAMTNLDSILKSRDITLPTKVHLVKAMFFPLVIYRCDIWTIKVSAEELMLLNCGVGDDSGESVGLQEVKPVNPKGNHPWTFIEGLMLKLKLQYFSHLTWRADSLEKTLMLGKIEGGRRRGWQRMKHDGQEFE